MKGLTVGYAMCGSFCTMADSLKQLEHLCDLGADVLPIFSEIVYSADPRFTEHEKLKEQVEALTGKSIVHTIVQAEPIGPKGLLDLLIVAPYTGNTIAKIAAGMTDSCVAMAVKAHLRNNRPVVLGIATNDALSASARNIGTLLNTRNIYFVPFGQDNAYKKPTSAICDFSKLIDTAIEALNGKQLQPLLLTKNA